MKPKQTFNQSEIQDGDIICFQRPAHEPEYVTLFEVWTLTLCWNTDNGSLPSTVIYTDARQYYDYLLNRITIKFAPLKTDTDAQPFNLVLSRKMSYEQFSTKVGEDLKVDPTHLRFAPVVMNSGQPKSFIKRTVTHTLQQILTSQYSGYGYSVHRPDALYYEILDTSLSEYETKKIIKVNWLPEGITKEVCLEIPSAVCLAVPC